MLRCALMKILVIILLSSLSVQIFAEQETVKGPEVRATKNTKKSKAYANDEAMTLEEEKKRGELQKSLEEPRISNKWFRGNYLIYDCDKGFYACVNSVSFEKCEFQRTSRKERRQTSLGCAPLKRFNTQAECFEVQYAKVHNQVPKIFCVHPNFR